MHETFRLLLLFFVALLPQVELTVVSGEYHVTQGSVVRYLTKFGVKSGNTVQLSGFINNSSAAAITCAFVPETLWEQIYLNDTSCDSVIYVSNSSLECTGKLKDSCYFSCGEHSKPTTLTNPYDTMYWHLILIACRLSDSATPPNGTGFAYHVTIVNDLTTNFFNRQFSYELLGVVIMTMCSTGVSMILLLFHLAAHAPAFKCWKSPAKKMHLLLKLYTLSLFLLLDGQAFQLVHWLVFAANGVGVAPLYHLGVAVGGLSTWSLVLVFVLVSKGWQMTTRLVHRPLLTVLAWGLYTVFSIILFVWTVVSQEVFPFMAGPDHPYHSWEGWLYQSYRIALLSYLLYELWHTYQQENNLLVMNVYRLLAVGFVVWFGYLPITVAALYSANTLEWTRVILSTSLFFDLAANFVLVILFCPLWSDYYFQFNSQLNVLIDTKRITTTRYTLLTLSNNNGDSL